MPITTREAQEQILGDLAAAIQRIALAVACLGEAYELLSVTTAERLENELFRPTQRAYGRGKRTHSEFAQRIGAEQHTFLPASAGLQSQGAKIFIEGAVSAAADADERIAKLQDSMLPVESGDAELRSGLAETRALLAELPAKARELLRTLGR